MHVLFIRSNSVNPDSRVEKEVYTLLLNGIDVDILCWDRESDHPITTEKKEVWNLHCPIHRVGCKASYGGGMKKNLIPLLRFQKAIKTYLKENHEEYDVIHACDFDTAFTAIRYAKKYGIRFVYDIFDYYVDAFNVPNSLKNSIERIDHNIIDHANAVIICSEEREGQIRGTKPQNLTVIHNSPMRVPSTNVIADTDISDKLKVAYIGILNDGRMLPELVDVISNNQQLELHIGGFGKYEQLIREYANRCENIVFYGKVPYDRTIEIEKECDVITAIYDPQVPNHIYAAPNKFYEGLMLGKALIMCRGTGMSAAVAENHLGVLIDYNVESLANALEGMYQNKKEVMHLAKRGTELYDSFYSWETMADRLITLYKKIS